LIDQLKEKVNEDASLTRRGRFLTTTFLIEVGSAQWLVSIVEGRIASITQGLFVMPRLATLEIPKTKIASE